MISALRKIEGRGELQRVTSAVMEMCIDNPREGFGELFDTHPSVDSRVAALVKFAGGHDPGPIALPPQSDEDDEQAAAGPWGAESGPGRASDDEASNAPEPWSEPSPGQSSQPSSVPSSESAPGPWGPHRGS